MSNIRGEQYREMVDELAGGYVRRRLRELLDQPAYGILPCRAGEVIIPAGYWHYIIGDQLH